ncbi:MAG: hypothetical protein JW814_04885 [Candidatus Krumholzibacteriota bacterium]|nr:hypothetical protein [Candidatus Krumholzibacteriota bacterium]
MRIDLLLKALCLIKTRTLARKGCEAGSIKLNGRAVKPSSIVSIGDRVEIRFPERLTVIELTRIPTGQISRKDRAEYFRVIRETPLEGDSGGWNA